MKSHPLWRKIVRAAAGMSVALTAVAVTPAPAQDSTSTGVSTAPASESDLPSGLAVTESPWTTVTPEKTLESVEGRESIAGAVGDALRGVEGLLAEPEVVGEVTFNYVGPAEDGSQLYDLEATVEFPSTPEGVVLADPEVSFVREQSDVPIEAVTQAAINDSELPANAVDTFVYPTADSDVELPADIPKDVTGDMITFDTQAVELEKTTTFKAEVALAEEERIPTGWSLYSGRATARSLSAGIAAFNVRPVIASEYGPVPANHTRLVVQVGGDRLIGGQRNSSTRAGDRLDSVARYSMEPGAVLQLYKPLNSRSFGNTEANRTNRATDSPVAINQPWATCTADVNGECVFDVPVEGTDTFPYYWIAMTKASPGFEVQKTMRTGGSGNSSTDRGTLYNDAYATPNMEPNKVFYSGIDYTTRSSNWGSNWQAIGSSTSFMYEAASPWDGWAGPNWDRSSLGVFQQVRSNPPLSNRCGLNVGFIIDTSGSMGSTGLSTIETILNGNRNVNGVFDSLKRTNTKVGLVSFSNSTNPSRNILTPLDIGNEADLQRAKDWVKRLRSGGGTNWEAPIESYVDYNLANPTQRYDVVYMITDGNPTRLDTKSKSDSGVDGEFRHVEAAMGMANTLKAQGTRIVPVGVPASWGWNIFINEEKQLDVSESNLQAISGPNPDGSSPSLRKSNFATYQNADVFRQALINTLNTCQISVERRFYEGQEDNVVPTPANTVPTNAQSRTWGFDAEMRPSVGSSERKTELPTPVPGRDNLVAEFQLNGTTSYSRVDIREQAGKTPEGWVPMDAGGGQNAQCTDGNGNKVNVANLNPRNPSSPTNDFSISNVPAFGGIHCIVYYRKVPEASSFDLRILKVDAADNSTSLDGAKFELRRLDTVAPADPVQPPNSENNNEFVWKNLPLGRYQLIETKAANGGYSLLSQPEYFKVDQDQGELRIFRLSGPTDATGTLVNGPGSLSFPIVGFEAANGEVDMTLANVRTGNLPKTGGVGFLPWALAGVVLSVFGVAVAAQGTVRRRGA